MCILDLLFPEIKLAGKFKYKFTSFRYAKLAKEEGGTINCGYGANGSSLNLPSHLQKGYFFPPTIVTNLPKGPIIYFFDGRSPSRHKKSVFI